MPTQIASTDNQSPRNGPKRLKRDQEEPDKGRAKQICYGVSCNTRIGKWLQNYFILIFSINFFCGHGLSNHH